MHKFFLLILLCLFVKNIFGQDKNAPLRYSEPKIPKDSIVEINGYDTSKWVWVKPKFKQNTKKSIELSGESIAASLDSFSIRIQGSSSLSTSIGSGVIISKKGYVLTNYHVVAGMTTLSGDNRILSDIPLRIIYLNSDRDIAICKLDGNDFNAISIGSSNDIHKGSTIYSMGSPLGYLNMFTKGIISAKYIKDNKYFLVHDASIGSGNSGGAVVNVRGELIGINVQAEGQQDGRIIQNINYAIPINNILTIVRDDGYIYVFDEF